MLTDGEGPPAIFADTAHALPDEELAQRAGQAGDNECFAELFARYRKKVFCACRGFFSDGQAAEDATQETFLRAYRNIRGFHQGDFSAWLMRIARNVCIDEWRRRRHETAIDEMELAQRPSSNPLDSSFEARWLAERVWQEMRLLPHEQRRCLELKIEGFSYEETALRTGLTISAVKSHIQNGRRMLWRKTEGALGEFVKS
jgi:RNA polymerase sigma-70 factor (ECF subfamily)